jgi:anti-sigma regulatory factor (Ser/Thr protein kinase)
MLETFYSGAFEDRREAYKTLSAFREAIDNAANHGNRYSPTRYLTVTLMRDPEKLELDVKDEGEGFDHGHFVRQSRQGSAASAMAERLDRGEHGGLGIRLMAECADEIRFSEQGTRLRLVKRLGL